MITYLNLILLRMHGLFGDFGIIAATEIICNCPLKKKRNTKP